MVVVAANFGFLAVISMAELKPSVFTESVVIFNAAPDVNKTLFCAVSSGILVRELRCSSLVFGFGHQQKRAGFSYANPLKEALIAIFEPIDFNRIANVS